MNPALLPLIQLGSTLIEKFIPNKAEQARAEVEFLKMIQEGELKVVLAQLEINAKEAAHPSVWVSGWRPFVGWTCGLGLAYQSIIHNILEWVSTAYQLPIPPKPDTETLIYVLSALLGVGALRTYEKKTGLVK